MAEQRIDLIFSNPGFSVTVIGSDHKGQSCLAHVRIGNIWFHHQENFPWLHYVLFIYKSSDFTEGRIKYEAPLIICSYR